MINNFIDVKLLLIIIGLVIFYNYINDSDNIIFKF